MFMSAIIGGKGSSPRPIALRKSRPRIVGAARALISGSDQENVRVRSEVIGSLTRISFHQAISLPAVLETDRADLLLLTEIGLTQLHFTAGEMRRGLRPQ